MTDAELKVTLLSHFYRLRHSNGGFVPVNDMIISGTEPVSLEQIGGVCRQLEEDGLIEWIGYLSKGPLIGSARIRSRGVDAVERGGSPVINIRFPTKDPRRPEGDHLRRDPKLIQELLEKLEQYPSNYGDVFSLNGSDPHLTVEGYTSEQIGYHLEQIRDMGLIDSPGSQPMLGVTFAGLSPRGHGLLERVRRQASPSLQPAEADRYPHKVFVVHGRDEAAKNEVALFLRTLGLEPTILHLRPNGGRHLLTKFTEESEGASFAVVLMTPDDEGGLSGAGDRRPRARQNVVFELGFLIGKLGPASVAALLKADVEKPSDFDGIAYITFDPSGRWKTDLARELLHAKVPFDPAKAFTA